MRHPHARWAIIAATFFLLETNDMSHHAVSSKHQLAPPLKVGHPPSQGRATQNGRSKAIGLHRQN